MTARRAGRRLVVFLAALVLHVSGATRVSGQTAWTPVRGEAALSVAFQQISFNGHFWGDGSKHEGDLPSSALVANVQFEYGFTDKLAFTARLPYIASKFHPTGDPAEVEFLQFVADVQRSTPGAEAFRSLDTGAYYATFQDFGLTLRYNALSKGLVVTPAIGVTIPSHNYRTVGEAAPGQNRLALHPGVNVGRLLDPFLPQAYIHARYTYSFVQRLLDVSLNRSNAEFEGGYAVTPLVGVRALAAWGHSHGGLQYEETLADPFLFLDHDRLLGSKYWHVGAGTTVALTDSIDLDVAVLRFLSGADTHYGWGVTVGTAWRFQPSVPASPAARSPLPVRAVRRSPRPTPWR